ncbi:MAG: carboxylesterase family protein [Prevotellaceae bacterium]|jgi:para-nitrobenzyl esterase|nr:carboxylesterase family protein [Prevotellaceae bacterium]
MNRQLNLKRVAFIATVFFTALFASCGSQHENIDVNNVKINSGTVSGKTTDDGAVKIFMGVPFAAPPVGELRWKAPQAVAAWEGVRECIAPPPSAMQGKPMPFFGWTKEFLIPEEPVSEDCLYLNVWTPAQTDNDKLPVIVWIHGGGFTGGSGTVPLYDGEAMARKGVVFVTVNYRLGIFGFFAHPELSAETENHISGNYGILDQIAALQWVRDNIATFGGDPDRVTIAGQSAGAMSVNLLVVSPLAKGLFSRAIAQSGGMFGKSFGMGQTLHEAEASGKQLTDHLGVSINDLRLFAADSILKIRGRFSTVVDSVVILPVSETFAEGRHNDVSLISGWNADDGVSFGSVNSEMFKQRIKMQYGENADRFLEVFPANTDEEAAQSQKLLSSITFGWNNYTWAKLQSETGKHSAYLYYFKRVPPGEPNYGAFHSAEFAYALHTLHKWDRPFTDVDYRLEDLMSSYWVNFAATGNPNGEGLPLWSAFNNDNPQIIEFGDETQAAPLPFQKQLYFMNEINQ